MPFYEHVFVARQDISPQQVETLAADLTKVIEANGGQVKKTENWGLRNLAYKISKNRKGHYVLLNIEAPATLVTELERNVRLNEDIIRHLTVRVEALEEGPSAVMQVRPDRDRGDRGDRGRRGDRGERGGRWGEQEAEEISDE
ncbi:MAG: 30S ribosomal protein S6 [Proteobacteria bacterium]|jgi:small subunit ribosomal protein S6|nr:MAG: 30S ribosomal protein S6 [Pseudomonadota bacterium]